MKLYVNDGAVFAANVNLSQAAKKAKSLKYVETVEEGEEAWP